ncbi:Ada metal-binding domain-containing protein [Flagellimonas nanhaiensis]|uniref:Metal-binding protein n=1 Tax=Flagellimonas nanhaiensis TaxID=2292706 RepID=A0A371JRE9_9FLAO|nr:Ada metal-binding domain-containing protein [Allomuricauda nanhaiensis]RDY60102.1 metal-binding protein [Allomuricauda nanhaiensis]
MLFHAELSSIELFKAIKQKEILWAGNKKLKIYGTLGCKSGNRMKTENRVFFKSEDEAILEGFRPCGHCLRSKYVDWKNNKVIFDNKS